MRRTATSFVLALLALALVLPAPAVAQTPAEFQLLQRVTQQPSDVSAMVELAKLYVESRRLAEAEQMLLRALMLVREQRMAEAQPDTVRRAQGVATAFPEGPQAPLRIGGDIREPKKIRDVRPVYPDIARTAAVQGIVILEVIIDRAGAVRDARVLRSVPLLDEASLDAVRQWLFTPTLLNGAPVEVVMTVTVNFTLGL